MSHSNNTFSQLKCRAPVAILYRRNYLYTSMEQDTTHNISKHRFKMIGRTCCTLKGKNKTILAFCQFPSSVTMTFVASSKSLSLISSSHGFPFRTSIVVRILPEVCPNTSVFLSHMIENPKNNRKNQIFVNFDSGAGRYFSQYILVFAMGFINFIYLNVL